MKLTSERCSGIKKGYWSPAKKDDLVQKIGAIEGKAPRLLADICDTVCPHSPLGNQELDAVCRSCPANKLVRLIDI